MLTAKIILNPYSNRWNASKRWQIAEKFLDKYGIHYSLSVSDGPGCIEKIAAQAVHDGFSPIIAAGGDGTIGEAVNGIMYAATLDAIPPFGVIPLGTANDLVFNLNLPTDIEEAVKIIALGNTVPIDVCKANDRYFVNNSAVGLEPYVTTIQQEMSYLKGIPRYLAAALIGISRNPVWQAKVTWNNNGRYDGPLTLLTVGNGARTGGLFFMSPNANPVDGKLTAVLAYRPSSLSILTLLPKTMSPKGSFIHAEGIQEIVTDFLNIEFETPSPAHCDGELFPEYVSSIQYTIIPAGIHILTPLRQRGNE